MRRRYITCDKRSLFKKGTFGGRGLYRITRGHKNFLTGKNLQRYPKKEFPMSMSRYYLVSENAHCNMWISSNDLNYQINQRLSIQRAGWSWQKVIKTFGNKCHLCFLCKKPCLLPKFSCLGQTSVN